MFLFNYGAKVVISIQIFYYFCPYNGIFLQKLLVCQLGPTFGEYDIELFHTAKVRKKFGPGKDIIYS